MRKLIFLIVVLNSCSQNKERVEDERLYYKKIEMKNYTLNWFFYSDIGSNTPDIITLENEQGIDTLCFASNIYDVNLIDFNTILISFNGRPKLYGEKIEVGNQFKDFKIQIDTASRSLSEKYKYHFKVNKEN